MAEYDYTKNFFGDIDYIEADESINLKSYTSKKQTISLVDPSNPDNKIGPNSNHLTISGDVNNIHISKVTGASDALNGATQELANATLTGDAMHISASTFTGGADSITLSSINSGDAILLGDAKSVNAGTTRGGNDSILVTGAIQGVDADNKALIVGDIQTLVNTNLTAGSDKITLQGAIEYANIYTDAETHIGVNTLSGGNDTLTLGIAPTKAMPTPTIHLVDNTHIDLGHGNNMLNAYSTLGANTTLISGQGNDKLTLNETHGVVRSGAGNDSLYVSANAGTIYTESGNDRITMSGASAQVGIIYAGDGNDTFSINVAGNSDSSYTDKIYAEAGRDSITINTATELLVYGGADSDRITINKNIGQSTIRGGNSDTSVTDLSNDTIIVKGVLTGSFLYGDGGNDVITITQRGSSTSYGGISGDDGNDTLSVTTATATLVDGGSGNDFINIGTLSLNNITGSAEGGAGNDKIIISKVSGQNSLDYSVDGEEGNDSITITTLEQGVVLGGLDNDTIKVTNANANSSINAGLGHDKITVSKLTDSTIRGDEATNIAHEDDAGLTKLNGNDSINVTTAINSNIYGDNSLAGHASYSGHNYINVGTSINSSIFGSVGNDTIIVKNLHADTAGDASSILSYVGNDSIKVTSVNGSSISGGSGNDTISLSSVSNTSFISSGTVLIIGSKITFVTAYEDDKIKIANASNSIIVGDGGNDTISIDNMTTCSVQGHKGNDSIYVGTTKTTPGLNSPTIRGDDGDDTIIVNHARTAHVIGGLGNDSIKITTVSTANIYGDHEDGTGNGNDTVYIGTLGGNDGFIKLGAGNDSLTIKSNKNYSISDSDLSDALGTGNDTLNINWKFSGTFNAGDDGATLITTGFSGAYLNFGAGDDGLIVTGSTGNIDTRLAELLGTEGQDTLQVNWAFNGEYYAGNDGGFLIAKGLTKNADLNFDNGDDGFIMSGSLSGAHHIDTFKGSDFISISSTHMQGDDALFYHHDGQDSIVFKGTYTSSSKITAYNDIGNLGRLATGDDGGSIQLDTWVSGDVAFGVGNDTFTVTKTLNGTKAEDKTIFTHAGNDSITFNSTNYVTLNTREGLDTINVTNSLNNSTLISGTQADIINIKSASYADITSGTNLVSDSGNDTVTINSMNNSQLKTGAGNDSVILGTVGVNNTIDVYTGADIVSIASIGSKSTFSYNSLDIDHITIKGTYNYGMVTTDISPTGSINTQLFSGLHTGSDGGYITLDTLGTGSLGFGSGADTLTINKNIVGTYAYKDIYTLGGEDSIILASVSGAQISAGENDDYISAMSLGAAGVLKGEAGNDTIQIGRVYADFKDIKTTTTLKSGVIDAGSGHDSIFIGHSTNDPTFGAKGNMSGGVVYAGDGNDNIFVGTLSGSARIEGGSGANIFSMQSMSGGSINTGDDTGNIVAINNTFSRGTINGGAAADKFSLPNTTSTMSGGVINAHAGNDSFSITNMKGGTIYGADGADSLTITQMQGGTINGGNDADIFNITNLLGGTIHADSGADIFNITNMRSGAINGNDNADTFNISETMYKGTINGNDGNDVFDVDLAMRGGTFNGNEGNDIISVTDMYAGIINGHEGNEDITTTNVYGGSINTHDGDDSISINHMHGGTIHLGEGNNLINIKNQLLGGKIIAGKGDDTLVIEDGVELGTKYSIDLGLGNNAVSVFSNLENQALTLGAKNDHVALQVNTSASKINLGAGNDTLTNFGYTITNTIIDASTGNDIINLNDVNTGTIIYGGIGNDNISVSTATNTIIDAGTGNNIITIGNNISSKTSQTTIIGGGNDSITVKGDFIDGSIISTGTGNDSIFVNSLLDGITIAGSIRFDNRGSDTIKLDEYKHGIIVDSKGQAINLATGSDGGSIEISNWIDGQITFGAGNDKFIVGNSTLTDKGTLNFSTGNDTIVLQGVNGTTKILFDNRGSDHISLNSYTKGVIVNNKGQAIDLATGTDGGKIELGAWHDTALNPIYFGNGHDTFILRTALEGEINLHKGNDSIEINSIDESGKIIFDTAGKDSITIDQYAGQGFCNINGDQVALSTGNDGGKIELGTWTGTGLEFGNGHDEFVLHSQLASDIDLKLGTDTITIKAGNASTSSLNGGLIIYDNKGFDSIILEGSYNGMGNNTHTDAQRTLSTGADGGSISMASITAQGLKFLAFDKGADYLNIHTMNLAGQTIALLGGNDTVNIDSLVGNIDAGEGNNNIFVDTMNAASSSPNTILSGNGNDTITINTAKINSLNSVISNGGADSITLGEFWGQVDAGDGKNTIFADTFTGTLESGKDADFINIESLSDLFDTNNTINIDVWHGNNKITIDDIRVEAAAQAGKAYIYSGDGKDTFDIGILRNLTINSNAGNDSLVFDTISGENSIIYAGTGSDIIRITNLNAGKIYTNMQDDGFESTSNSVFITTMHDGSIYGASSNEIFNITNMLGGGLFAGSGNDRITINYASGEIAGDAKTLTIKPGSDIIKITTAEDLIIYGDTRQEYTVGGNDSISIDKATDVDIYAQFGHDTIKIESLTGNAMDQLSKVYGNALTIPSSSVNNDNDTVDITHAKYVGIYDYSGNNKIDLGTAESVTIDLDGFGQNKVTIDTALYTNITSKSDKLTLNITQMHDTTVNSGDSNDSITIGQMLASNINAQGGNNVINVNSMSDNSTISTGLGVNTISVTTMDNSNINGGDSTDNINIKSVMRNGSSIDAGSGDDIISVRISGDSQSEITGGDGQDVYKITGAKNSSITIMDFESVAGNNNQPLDKLFINGINKSNEALEAKLTGDNYTFDGITIYFS